MAGDGAVGGLELVLAVRTDQHARPFRRTALRGLHLLAETGQDADRRDFRGVLLYRQLSQADSILFPRATQHGEPHHIPAVFTAGAARRLARPVAAQAYFRAVLLPGQLRPAVPQRRQTDLRRRGRLIAALRSELEGVDFQVPAQLRRCFDGIEPLAPGTEKDL